MPPQSNANIADALDVVRDVRDAMLQTTVLSSILDGAWFDNLLAEIAGGCPPDQLQGDRSGFVFDFTHMLRGQAWFEEAQRRVLDGHPDQASLDAISFTGLDHLKTVLPKLDRRLTAFSQLGFKQQVVRVKLDLLKSTRSAADFKNHLFEVAVLGDLALRGVLVDIEDQLTSSDGVIAVAGQRIVIEATHTMRDVIPRNLGPGGFSVNPDDQIDQVAKKVRKKAADGRQLALVTSHPTILFLARRHFGAGRLAADIALNECFASPDFARLSAVVVADSWRFHHTSLRPAPNPGIRLSSAAIDTLREWYG